MQPVVAFNAPVAMFAALPSGPVRTRFAPTMRSKTLATHRSVHPRRPFPSATNLRTLHGRVAISAWGSWGATIILAVDEGAQTVSIIGVFYGGQDHEGPFGRAGATCLARRSSRTDHINEFSGPASGMAGDRGDDLAGVQRTKRSGVNGTPLSSSSGPRSRAA